MEQIGDQRDLSKKTKSTESLRDALIRHGLVPERITEFIDNHLERAQDLSELKKDVTSKVDYCKEQLVINDVSMLRLLLEE